MNKFLFELGLEEIPPYMITPALEHLSRGCAALLDENQVPCEMRTFSSPRRLALLLEGLPDRQPDRKETVLGPPVAVAYKDGKPTRAAEGFAGKEGVSVSDLKTVETEKGQYLAHERQIGGRPLPDILTDVFLQGIRSLSWPKNMYWRESRFRFIRPIRWLLALWNDEILPLELEGVRAGRTTRGHRFLGQQEISLADADQYEEKLRENFVLVRPEERRRVIQEQIEAQIPQGLQLLPDPALLETLVHLTEYPGVIRGTFSQDFLKLPQEVLVTVMRHHQKYFSVVDRTGAVQPWFLAVLNMDRDPEGRICQVHEKVLQARLEDASFFWEADRKKPLAERAGDLDQVLFQEKLGTYRDKTERIQQLCRQLEKNPDLDTAASLCKVDLTTEMVREFTELQGEMGGLYAREEGYPEVVWKAIYEHYKPVSLEDESPSSRNGALLSIADKIDTVVGCFGIGILPTGSSDPFALRRQSLGFVKVLFDHQFDYSLEYLVEQAQKNFPSKRPKKEVRHQVLDFLRRRVRYVFQEKGIAYDVLNAVLSIEIRNVYDAYERARALAGIRGEEDFEALAMAYKRIKNILAGQTIKARAVSEKQLVEPEEKNLYHAYLDLRPQLETQLKNGDYIDALKRMAGLRQTVDRFFDKVLVMSEDEKLRRNRLRMLHEISQLFLTVADISEIVQEGK